MLAEASMGWYQRALTALGGGEAEAQPPAEDPKEDRGQRPQEEGGLLLVRVEGVDH